MNNTTFGNTLNKLKADRGLTSRELAYNAGIGEGLISGLIHDQRVIGESTARKLGNALHLTGAEFEDFVYAAINNCSEKTLEYSKQYPAELINLVVGKLKSVGILPSEIKRCIRKDEDADAALYLNDGTEALIKLELAFT
jgi:transcriptional regulator with XRE-family HTH domain